MARRLAFERFDQAELRLCRYLNRSSSSTFVRQLFRAISWLGDGWIWYSLLLALPLIYGAQGGLAALHMGATALVGVVISVGALGGLVVSYGRGLFGWREAGFRTPIELAVITEVGAVICLSAALAAWIATPRQSGTPPFAASADPTDSTTADVDSRPSNGAVLVDLRTGVRNTRRQHHSCPEQRELGSIRRQQ